MFSALLKNYALKRTLPKASLRKKLAFLPETSAIGRLGKASRGIMRLLRLPEFSRCPPTTYSKLNRPPQKRATTSSPIRRRRV